MMYKVDAMFDSFSKAATALRVSVLFLALLCAQGFPSAAPAWAEPESGLTLDFKDADIHALIKYISEATGRNFITDPTVKGKVTVYSPVKISPDEAFETFVSILRVQGYAVQKSGTAYKIVPLKEGLGQGEDAAVGRKMGSELETVVTQIVPLKVGVAAELAKILPSLLGKDYAISAYTPSNTLALTAPAPNVAKAMAFLEQVEASDTAGTSATLGLQYGDSKTLAATLAKILKSRDEEYAKKGRPTVSLVLADERTNSLLIYGDPEAIGMARDAVGSLDIPTPKGKGDVHLISLSNAKAEDLAQVINTLVERQRAAGTEDQKPDTVLSKDIKVVADKSTNSLVVTARPDEFEALSNIVAKLDVVRKQVFIEALIMEVSSEASFSFGINWAIGGNTGDAAIVGGVSLNGGTVSLSSSGANKTVSLPAGVSIGAILKDAITVGNTSYNIQSILNAVRGNSDVDVLATPQLLTLDNEEASVEVVDNIPFTKESTTRNDNDFTTQSMDYKDVGVKLKITPRISDDGSLRLEVEQEVSRVTQGLITLTNGDQLVAPTTRKRLVKTTILLQDSQTAVIGGLLDDQKTYNQSEVPGLGSIPGLGWLFKSRNKKSTQTNLFIFITPKVIRNAADSADLTREKQLVLHETSVGHDGLGLPIMSKPKLLKPVFVN